MVQRINRLLMRVEDAGHGRAVAAPIDLGLDPEQTVLQPDLLFIAADRLHMVRDDAVYGAPDVVVEVLFDTSRRRGLGPKRRLYAGHAVPAYRVVDPAEQVVRVYEFQPGGERPAAFLGAGALLSCALFPGVTMRVDSVFTD